MDVRLSADELRLAAEAGVSRRISALGRKRRGAHGFDRDFEAWSIDIEGVAAEWAAAKGLGLDYEPVVDALDTEQGDIAPGIQVRSTRYGNGHLLLHESDIEDHRFILVVGLAPEYRLAGWTTPAVSRKPEFWKVYKGRGAYWIPQEALLPVRESLVRAA